MVAIEQQDSAVEIVVAYEGPAVAEHRMPVADLAPALLALEQTFVRTNALLNGDRGSVSLEVRAPQQGSFEIVVTVLQVLEGASDFLSADFISSAANAKELLLGGPGLTGGLYYLIKRLRGRRPEIINPESDIVTLQADNLQLSVPNEIVKLFLDSTLRQDIENTVRPVTKDGVDRVIFREGSAALETIEKDEAPYFRAEVERDETITRTMIPEWRLKLSTVRFVENRDWRLTDGGQTRGYAIKDDEFIQLVRSGQRRLGAEDILVCDVVMIQSTDAQGGLSTTYEITKVVKHIRPPEPVQSQMFPDD